jgi:hypothetical protein
MRTGISLLLAMAACSSMQTGYRQTFNEEWEGKHAPPIEGGTWVAEAGSGKQEFAAADYRVLAFFSPT